jgi:hypothetical protein
MEYAQAAESPFLCVRVHLWFEEFDLHLYSNFSLSRLAAVCEATAK